MRQPFLRIGKGLFLALALGLFLCGETNAQKIQAAFVTRGAFLLSEKPTLWRSGRLVHDLIGYLPIGTVVYFDEGSATKKLFNWETDREEKYLLVETDIGMAGLLREDLKVNLEKTPSSSRLAIGAFPSTLQALRRTKCKSFQSFLVQMGSTFAWWTTGILSFMTSNSRGLKASRHRIKGEFESDG